MPSKNRAAAIENVIFELSTSLAGMGCEVYVLDVRDGQHREERFNLRFREIDVPLVSPSGNHLVFTLRSLLFAVLSLPALRDMINRDHVQLVHTHHSYSALTTLLLAKLKKIRTVHTTHAHDLIMVPTFANYLKGIPEILVLMLTDHIIAETPAVKSRLVSTLLLDPARITVAYSGVNCARITSRTSINAIQNPEKKKIVLCVGRVSQRKNQMVAVRAAAAILETRRDVSFVFAGPIDELGYFSEIQNLVESRSMGDSVKFTGELTDEQLRCLYREASLFLFPTTAEIQGLVLLEAMCFGLPIIASDIGPISDVAKRCPGTIILINPHDPNQISNEILRLIDNPSMMRSMSQKSRLTAMDFSWERTAEQCLSIYAALLAKDRRGHGGEGGVH